MKTFKEFINEAKKGWHLIHDEDFEMEDGSWIESYWVFNGTREVGRIEDARQFDGTVEIRSYAKGDPLSYVDLTRIAGKLDIHKAFAKFIKTSKGKNWLKNAV